jgi:pantetheine-phosphate adenylyltransferase
MTRIAFYPGSFDPVTRGHTDIIERALALVDELVIGIGIHPAKAPLFAADERIAMLEAETKPLARKAGVAVRVITFDNLAIEAAREAGASIMIRGIRDGTDFDYEMQLAGMNGDMAPGIETVFLAASPQVRHIAANLVRQIAAMHGDIGPFVSAGVARRLKAKIGRQPQR